MSNRRILTIALFLVTALLSLYLVPHELQHPRNTLTALEMIVFGVLVGSYGTMVGVGGGFLIVPALLLAFGLSAEQAAGTSITVVFLNAFSGTVSYARQKRIDYRAGSRFAIATIPGAIGGAFLTGFVGGRVFDIVFGSLLIALSLFLLWRPVVEEEYAESLIDEAEAERWLIQRTHVDKAGGVFEYAYDVRHGVAISAFVGVLSSMLGIGGGIIHVPALIHLLNFPAHLATATSQFILVVTALVGMITHLVLGNVLPGPAILMGVGAISGAQIGAALGRKLKGSLLIRLLSLALIVVALKLLLRF